MIDRRIGATCFATDYALSAETSCPCTIYRAVERLGTSPTSPDSTRERLAWQHGGHERIA
jgi:hypothetical protein